MSIDIGDRIVFDYGKRRKSNGTDKPTPEDLAPPIAQTH
jgi:hypothetical protein